MSVAGRVAYIEVYRARQWKNNPLEKLLYFTNNGMYLSQTFRLYVLSLFIHSYLNIHIPYPTNFIEATDMVQ